MYSIRLRKQKVSSKNAAQIGLTSADHKGHRQSRQLHSTSKAAEDRRTPGRKRTQANNKARSNCYPASAGECGRVLPLWIRAKLLWRRQGFGWLSAISDRCPNRLNTALWRFLVSGFACARRRNERRQLQPVT